MKRPKPHRNLHRCCYCHMASRYHLRWISSAGMSSDYVYSCRSEKACRKRLESRGVIIREIAANPEKIHKAVRADGSLKRRRTQRKENAA